MDHLINIKLAEFCITYGALTMVIGAIIMLAEDIKKAFIQLRKLDDWVAKQHKPKVEQDKMIKDLQDMVHTDHFACLDREKRLREEVERTTKQINILKECVLGLLNGSNMQTCCDVSMKKSINEM